MLGEIALYALVVLIVTGTFLTFFFQASSRTVAYHGSYKPLRGTTMSEAYRSTVQLSQDVRAGLVVRQMHHWAALIFLAAIVCHLCRIFFTGSFRKPREPNWVIGVTLLVLGMANGFTGYSLPDDLLSGTGLRVAYSIATSVPIVGPWLASLFFGGASVGPPTTGRLYVIHVLIVPAAIVALVGVHLGILWRQKHAQFPGAGRAEPNVVGSRLWPTYAARSVALFMFVVGVVALLAGLVQINPVWLYGPYKPAAVSTAAQPDWYLGWTEGALRLMPSMPVHVFGYRLPEVFLPGVVLPGITFVLLYAWPVLEARFTHDHAEHHLLDRPRDRPWRTAIGAGVLTFYVVLFVAGAQDIWASRFDVSVIAVRDVFRVVLFALPVAVAAFTGKACADLRKADPPEAAAERGTAPIAPNEPDVSGEGIDDPDGDDDLPGAAGGHAAGPAVAAAAAAAVAAGAAGARAGYRWGRRRPRRILIQREPDAPGRHWWTTTRRTRRPPR
ncbi:MAG TPA: ubiquinol-cytochrome c reductase cytochrome b subunit [Acidimicrobiales bacterium]